MRAKSYIKQPDTFERNIIVKLKLPHVRFFIGVVLAVGLGFVGRISLGFDVKESIALASAGVVCVTLWYNALNLKFNHALNERKIAMDRKTISLNLMTEWYKDLSNHSSLIRDVIQNHRYDDAKKEDLNSYVESNMEIKKAIIPILNYFEKICLAIDADLADEELLKKYFCTIFITYYDCFAPFIKKRRTGVHGTPDVYVYFWETCVAWGAKEFH